MFFDRYEIHIQAFVDVSNLELMSFVMSAEYYHFIKYTDILSEEQKYNFPHRETQDDLYYPIYSFFHYCLTSDPRKRVIKSFGTLLCST